MKSQEQNQSTGNDRYSGHGYSGIDRYSGTKTPDDAILFTVSGITVLVELFLENFGTFCQFSYIFYAKSNDLWEKHDKICQKILKFQYSEQIFRTTGNDRYSGHGYSGIDRFSGTKNPDDAILFTFSGITAVVEQKFREFRFFPKILMRI